MDGANMNAIAGIVDLDRLGVDAVHNNLHKTWTIPHGGGGPGDAIVAVSKKLVDFLPGKQINRNENHLYEVTRAGKSIGDFHRHWGNFGHKVRAFSYLLRLGNQGIPRMSSIAVLSARYLWARLKKHYSTLPAQALDSPRMHEFILTLSDEEFKFLEDAGIPKSKAIPQIGKLFLDFGFHAPTVAFPEVFGLMIEPTESFTKKELDRFADAVIAIKRLIMSTPEVLNTAPHFTPIDLDEVSANRNLIIWKIRHLPLHLWNKDSTLQSLSIEEIHNKVIDAHRAEPQVRFDQSLGAPLSYEMSDQIEKPLISNRYCVRSCPWLDSFFSCEVLIPRVPSQDPFAVVVASMTSFCMTGVWIAANMLRVTRVNCPEGKEATGPPHPES